MEDFEKGMKDYFEKRELHPSQDVWERMEMLLDTPKIASKKNKIPILSIAASIVLMVGLWTFFKKTQIQVPEKENDKSYVIIDSLIKNRSNIVNTTPSASNIYRKIKNKTGVNKRQTQSEELSYVKTVETYLEEERVDDIKGIKEKKLDDTSQEIFYNEQIDLVQNAKIKIDVNPNILLHRAEMERQLEKLTTINQKWGLEWKEDSTVAENFKQ